MKKTYKFLTPLAMTLMALGMTSSVLAAGSSTQQVAPTSTSMTATKAPLATPTTRIPDLKTASAGQEESMDAKKTSIDPNRFNSLRDYLFTDVKPDYWAAPAITTMAEAKILSGYSDGTFHPEQALKREEAAIIFDKLIGDRPGVMLASPYADITSDRFSALAIDSVSKKNIMSGYGDNSFKPEQFMSRQEFAVVADNYLHYVGYQTEDPTSLDDVAYADQKFVASWAQDAVRELASLGFLMYNKNTLFNPEKYITRAEAAEITYRMTYTPQALKIKQDIVQGKILNRTINLIDKALDYDGDFSKFYNKGALYWTQDGTTLIASIKDKKSSAKVQAKLAEDQLLRDKVHVINGKYSQADFDSLQASASDLYKATSKNGAIDIVRPNDTGDQLIIYAKPVTDTVSKAFQNKFGNKVIIQTSSQDNKLTWERPITYNFGLDQRKLAPKNK